MNAIHERLENFREVFSMFSNPLDRFSQLMDMAKNSTDLPDELQIKDNQIVGCMSQAWVVTTRNDDGTFRCNTDSDALLVKGLLTILETIFKNLHTEEILEVDSHHILENIGLGDSITSQRTNGFLNAVNKIKSQVIEKEKQLESNGYANE